MACAASRSSPDSRTSLSASLRSSFQSVTTANALSVMTGFNPGFIWSLINRPGRHYRVFSIPKGNSCRQIEAPRAGLKTIQKWLSFHFVRKWRPHDAVRGFVPGKSHITAARIHVAAEWVISVDIDNFFPTTPECEIRAAFTAIGYRTIESLEVLLGLCCYKRRQPQGAPTSPVLSNIALDRIDRSKSREAERYKVKFTRYADDIVFSGKGNPPEGLLESVDGIFSGTPWMLSDQKRTVAQLPGRLKVHDLLVHGEKICFTKGCRNRLRAYNYLYNAGRIPKKDIARIRGHLNYGSQLK